jgi:GNAT superfamily N-acetyltransferase
MNLNSGVRIEFRLSESVWLAALGNPYSELLFPPPLSQTQGKPLNEPLSGVVALHDEKPIGLILCEPGNAESARIICWSVLPAFRNKGIGNSLLEYLEHTLLKRGKRNLILTFRSDLPAFKVIEKVLNRRCWSTPRIELKLYKVTAKSFNEPAWFSRVKLAHGCTLFPWRELSGDDRAAIIEKQKKTGWYPRELTPFQEESKIEWSNSLGLRQHGEVVGWLITHRVAPDVIQYTSLFVSHAQRSLAGGLPLIVESIRRHRETQVSRAIFQVRSENKSFMEFVDRRLSQLLATSADRMITTKELGQDE